MMIFWPFFFLHLLEISCKKKLSLLPPFRYECSDLFLSVWTQGHVAYSMSQSVPIPVGFVAQIVAGLGASSGWLLSCSSTCIRSSTARYSRLTGTFPAPISSRHPGSFWEVGFRSQERGAGGACAAGLLVCCHLWALPRTSVLASMKYQKLPHSAGGDCSLEHHFHSENARKSQFLWGDVEGRDGP